MDLPLNCKPLSSKWVFKRKRKVDGSIDKDKERLVIKGHKQSEGLDYFEVHQMDVKIFFLNGELDEEIYIE